MIALIGMAGRFPGAPGLCSYWDLLMNGREGLTRLTPDELLAAGVPPETLADRRYVPAAATLHGFDRFDAGFWDTGGHEAALMDPQQRIMLELAWHALEDAGIDPHRADASVGVFVGAAISTYLLFQLRQTIAGPSAPSQLLAMMGNDKDYMATQLAYRLDLRGPAVSVQSACSSSLVAVHMACQSLLSGECDIALAGGVSVRVPHRVGYLHEAGGMLSPDGHCRSYAEDAAGTVFGSGAGLVVLRRSEDARADRVRARLLGSAVNNDGNRKIGFAAPSQARQAAVIAEAMAVADIRPADIGYVEGHGTGTPLGDPVEVAALASAFRGAPAGSVRLGSAKSNIGHAETAAGVAGLIKAVLMLEHGTFVPTLHAAEPSSRIAWEESPFRLAQDARPWTERLVAGVSSFGIGGTNAHVVLARAPEARGRSTASRLVVSARDPAALRELAAAYQARVAAEPAGFPVIAGAAARRPRLPLWAEIAPDGTVRPGAASGEPAPEVSTIGEGPPVDLPPYPFQRSRHWFSGPERLLGDPVPTPSGETLRPVNLPLGALRQHIVAGRALLPAALYLALTAELGWPIVDLEIERPLVLEGKPIVQLWQAPDGSLRVMAERDGAWECLATARRSGSGAVPVAWVPDAGLEDAAVSGAEWAAVMAGAGLSFGPAFLPIQELHRSPAGVRGRLEADSLIAILDGGLQALGAAVGGVEAGFLPVSVGQFAGHGDIMEARTVLARLTDDTVGQKRGDVLWLDGGGRVVAGADGIVCRRAASGVANMLYRLVWRPEDDPALTAPHEVLERIACSFARQALAAVPSPARPAIASLLRPHATVETDIADPAAACQELAVRHPDHAAEIELVGRCGGALGGVLAGRRDPLHVLFGTKGGAHGAYRDSPLARRLNTAAAAVAAGGRPGRVIEIGGGTGATTRALRAVLPDTTEYLFTDISPVFLAAAAREFPGVRTAGLDIARDPASQGMEPGGWDLVVAANVLHAAPNLVTAIRHAVRLLAPGGRLLLVEGTGAQARLDITFGLTDEWSRQDDRVLRPTHPLVDGATWHRLLAEAGLQDTVTVLELSGQLVLTAVAGPPRWVAVGRDHRLAEALGLPLVPPSALPAGALDGVVSLAGLEQGRLGGNAWVAARRHGQADGSPDPTIAPGGEVSTGWDSGASATSLLSGGLDGVPDREVPLAGPMDDAPGSRASGPTDGAPGSRVYGPRLDARGIGGAVSRSVSLIGKWNAASEMGGRLPELQSGAAPHVLSDEGSPIGDLLILSRALIQRTDAPRLLVPTADPPCPVEAAVGGFLRTLAREHPEIRVRSIGLDSPDPAPVAIERVLDDGEDRVAWRSGRRTLARLEPLPPRRPEPSRLAHDLTLTPMAEPGPGAGEVLIKVRAAGINYKDVLTAAGQVPPIGPGLGGECAGEVEALGPGVTDLAIGDPVAAVAAGALATHVCADARLVLRRPGGLTFAQAAAVPIAGATAWHALHELARIRPGQRVLVHAASGGVGWFAVRLAQRAGAEVVATAGSPEKRALLRALGVQEVFSSRDTAFASAAPVDVTLGALPPAQRAAALRLLRPGGSYVEIGRGPEAETRPDRPDIDWHLVALDRVEAAVFAAILRQVMAAVAADPTLLPPVRTFPLEEAPEAFAAMMRASHAGKLVALPAHPAGIRADSTYLVTGGLGGLGPEIAAWLTRRGAGGVVRLARRALEGGLPDDVVIGDVTDPQGLAAVDAHVSARDLPPLRGVFHAAGLLEDRTVATLDPSSFGRVAAPKLDGLAAIRAHWPDLSLLVGFSSAGALFGSAGQAAHTAASAALDAVLEAAAAQGQAAVAIDWGAWRDLGAARARGAAAALSAGMGTISTGDGFTALDRIMETGTAHAAVLPIDRTAMRRGGSEPRLLQDPARGKPMPEPSTAGAARQAPTGEPEAAKPGSPGPAEPADRRAWLQERVAEECASMLAIRGRIEIRRPLQELGLDSLSALELRNRLGRLAGAVLPASLLFDYPTIAALTGYLAASHFGLAPEPVATPGAAAPVEKGEDAPEDDLDAVLSAFAARYGDDAA
jgi:NADPH:quinone reductase-like Zn-dependent oxidoreductase/3-oxoacyl-(acyl-carrier-protein) synthase/SAM-dependent methyltransferase/acyl carrier protein